MNRYVVMIAAGIAAVLVAAAGVLFFAKAKPAEHIIWGVDFSQSQAEYLRLDWRQAYRAVLGDLGVKHLKLHTNWDWIEGKQNDFYFNDVDWQVEQAAKAGADMVYVVGLKTGRWPECHIPDWAVSLAPKDQQAAALNYLKQVVLRYKDSKSITAWQVENEPLFQFGVCPSWYYRDTDFLKAEVSLVKSLDPSRQIIISDSGEQSLWLRAAGIGDLVGITMYRSAYAHVTDSLGFNNYFFLNSAATYAQKAALVKNQYGKNVICVELQAEPWTKEPLRQASLAEQQKSMNPDIFQENVAFAKSTGLDTFYFWGAEWWYWQKEVHHNPEMWQEAKKVIQSSMY